MTISRRGIAIVGLCVLLVSVAVFYTGNIHSHQRPKTAYTFVGPTGEHITNLFQGVTPNPLFGLDRIAQIHADRDRCSGPARGVRASLTTFVDRLIGVREVLAQDCGTPNQCVGDYWCGYQFDCALAGGEGCIGAGNSSYYDPSACPYCSGYATSYSCQGFCSICNYPQCMIDPSICQ